MHVLKPFGNTRIFYRFTYGDCSIFFFNFQVTELFSEFEEEPVGTASLAQVHRARLKDGSRVAVKVQHPRVKAHSFVDMKTMEVGVLQWT